MDSVNVPLHILTGIYISDKHNTLLIISSINAMILLKCCFIVTHRPMLISNPFETARRQREKTEGCDVAIESLGTSGGGGVDVRSRDNFYL
jgi:hypothetical protein